MQENTSHVEIMTVLVVLLRLGLGMIVRLVDVIIGPMMGRVGGSTSVVIGIFLRSALARQQR